MSVVGPEISQASFVVVRNMVLVIKSPFSIKRDSSRLSFAMMLPCLPTRLPYIDVSQSTPALKSCN